MWLDALDKNEITAVILCDMNAAFNLVNNSILLRKLKVFNCGTFIHQSQVKCSTIKYYHKKGEKTIPFHTRGCF